jgi:YD repeat-containing protein
MKLNLNLLPLLTALFLLLSCQKELGQEGTAGINNSHRVKTYTEAITSSSLGNSITTYNLSYDNSGRVTSIVSASSPGDKFVYAFPSATKFTMDLYNGGVLSIHEDFFLNSDFFVDSTFQYNNTKDSTTEKYIYNASKQLTLRKEYDYSKLTGAVLSNTTTYTYDAGGNLLKTQDTDGESHSFEYYANLRYAMPVVPGPITSASAQKKNLAKKHTASSNGFSIGSAEYTYTFDSKDRMSTEKAVLSDGSVVVKTYTYF